MFFFRQNVTSLCICRSFGYFSSSLFLRDNSKFQKRSASECPFWPCKKVPKIFRLGDYISFENMVFAKIFRVFSDFAQFFHMNHIEPSQNKYQLTHEDVFFKVVQVSFFYNYWALRKWRIKIGNFLGFFSKKFSKCRFCSILLLKQIEPADN